MHSDSVSALITDSAGILAILTGNAALWFFLEKQTKWKLFNFFPPLIFIYLIPGILSNTGVIPLKAPTYDWMKINLLPIFLVLLMLDVDVRAAIRVMGRGVLVMFAGTAGVVIGAPIAYFIVKSGLEPDAWKAFGTLAGSWIGGTGNMAAVGASLGIDGTPLFGLAVIADHAVYLVWLPLLLSSKNLAGYFHKFTGVTDEQLEKMKSAADELVIDKGRPEMRHILYLIGIAFAVTWIAGQVAPLLPELKPVLSTSTYRILIVTTFGLALSFSPAKKIPGSHILAMAMVYLFVARMGAVADVSGLASQALPFVAGAYIWIFIHGLFLLAAARILRVDVHTAAIASAANIGGAASAPVVAAFHDERLVPVSILMALIGYAIGNYAAFLAAYLCSLVP
jgi:uncharacterized membrane protein